MFGGRKSAAPGELDPQLQLQQQLQVEAHNMALQQQLYQQQQQILFLQQQMMAQQQQQQQQVRPNNGADLVVHQDFQGLPPEQEKEFEAWMEAQKAEILASLEDESPIIPSKPDPNQARSPRVCNPAHEKKKPISFNFTLFWCSIAVEFPG